MVRRLRGLLVLALLALPATAGAAGPAADAVVDITWDTLLPAEATAIRQELQGLQLQLRKLPAAAQAAIPRIAAEQSLRTRIEGWSLSDARLSPAERKVLEEAPSATFPEAAALWNDLGNARMRLSALEAVLNQPLDGQRVRLAGYLLPLDMTGENSREFLLVPFVGACIHVPPPPPNQIVHVSVADGYPAGALFEAVTVTGVLAASSGRYDLFLTDGEAPVDVGYRLVADAVAAVTAPPE